MMFRIIGSVVVLVGAVCLGQEPVHAGQPEAQSVFQLLELPHEGWGSVSVLDDGLLVVHVDTGFVPESREQGTGAAGWKRYVASPRVPEPDVERPGTSLWALYVFQADIETVRLVEADGGWFLDKDGEMIDARGLSASQVSVKGFSECAEQGFSYLLAIVGTVSVGHGSAPGFFRIQAVDDETGEVFVAAFRPGEPRQALSGEQAAEDTQPRGSTGTCCVSRGACCCTGTTCEVSVDGRTATCRTGNTTTTCTEGGGVRCRCETSTTVWPIADM